MQSVWQSFWERGVLVRASWRCPDHRPGGGGLIAILLVLRNSIGTCSTMRPATQQRADQSVPAIGQPAGGRLPPPAAITLVASDDGRSRRCVSAATPSSRSSCPPRRSTGIAISISQILAFDSSQAGRDFRLEAETVAGEDEDRLHERRPHRLVACFHVRQVEIGEHVGEDRESRLPTECRIEHAVVPAEEPSTRTRRRPCLEYRLDEAGQFGGVVLQVRVLHHDDVAGGRGDPATDGRALPLFAGWRMT